MESATLYSVETTANWYCGGAHPEAASTALTLELRTGAPYDLGRAFHVSNNGHLADAAVPILADYMNQAAANCAGVTPEDDLQRADLTLGVTDKGLIFYFGVEHVIAACYPPVQVPFAALAPVADRPELQRLGPPLDPQAGQCSGAIIPGADNEVSLATVVTGSPRVRFISASTGKLPGCPSDLPACQLPAYLVPGDRVLVGERSGGYRCATFQSVNGHETSGFLPAATLVDQSTSSPALTDWAGRWTRDQEASITISVQGTTLAVKGNATWGALDPTRVKRGGVHIGDIDAVTTPRGNLAAIGSDYDGAKSPDISKADDCRARLRLFGDYLVVEDNTGCGGVNVSFTGVYSRGS